MAISGIGSTSPASRNFSSSHDALKRNIERLSSGKQINNAVDNAAGLAIANQLISELNSQGQAGRNISDGLSQSDISDGAMESQAGIVSRMRELALQSSNDTLSDSARGSIQTEFASLQAEIGRIAEVTEFNGQPLLAGGESELQVGTSTDPSSRIALATPDMGLDSLGLQDIDLSTASGSRLALDAFDAATDTISEQRAVIGATRNRLMGAKEGTEITMENIAAAASRIEDTDVAAELSEMSLNRARETIAARLSSHEGITAGMLVDLVG